MTTVQDLTMEAAVIPTLDPSDRRLPAPRTRRLWAIPAVGLGALAVIGTAYGTYAMLGRAAAPSVSKIRIGPIADMPDIRDGVPALMTPPARVVTGAPAETRASAVQPQPAANLLRPPTLAPPTQAALANSPRDAAGAKALEMTVATAELRPSFGGRARDGGAVVAAGTQPTEPPRTVTETSSTRMASTSAPRTIEISAREPVRAGPQPVELPAPEPNAEASGADAVVPAPVTAIRPAAVSPLPPARPVVRVSEPQPDRSPAARPRSAAVVPPAPAARPSAPVTSPPATAQQAPAPQEDRAQVFGVPLPGFVPTGRQIREAAGSVADMVTSIPGRF